MLLTPQYGRVTTVSNAGIVGVAGAGSALVSNATTLLEGAIVEMISAANNTQESWGIAIDIFDTGLSGSASEACLDILAAAATEDVLISNLICGYATHVGHHYFFPLHIPSGTRISARLASVRTSITARVVCTLFGGGIPPWRTGRKVTTYGTPINGARGQALTLGFSGATAVATQITASTSEDHFAFLPGFQPATDTGINIGYFSVGIGVGAATEDCIGTWTYRSTNLEDVGGPFPIRPAFQTVPAGSRLTILGSSANVDDSPYDGLIYAVS